MSQSTDGINIDHLINCPGCSECDILLSMYESCEFCGDWGHNTVMAVFEDENGEMVPFCDRCESFVVEMGSVAAGREAFCKNK